MAKQKKTTKNKTHKTLLKFTSMGQGVFLLLGSFLLFLSLLTFSNGDPRVNAFGLVGHLSAWFFVYLIGLSSYLLPIFLAIIGYHKLLGHPIERFKSKMFYGTVFTLSLSVMLAMAAQSSPFFAELFRGHVYADFYPRGAYDPHHFRYYLGGLPLHLIYLDTAISLRQVLGGIGSFFLFFSLFLLSGSLLTNISLVKYVPKLVLFLKTQLTKRRPKLALNLPKPLPKRPFKEEEPLPSLSRENPMKREMRIKLPENKPTITQKTAPEIFSGGSYSLPSAGMLTEVKPTNSSSLSSELKRQAQILEETLLSFGIEAKVGDIHCGPTITSFEVHPAVGVKVQKIKALENDIALNMEAKSIRIIAPIPGKAAVGIEVPNAHPQEVGFRGLLEAYQHSSKKMHIPLLLGKLVNGDDLWADLTKMPHLIIAGATGSGKSVCINTIVMSLVMNAKPESIKLVMVDPKKVELTAYTHLPHMLAPVITEPGGACAALGWLVKEMERRYEIFRQLGIRNIHSFNTRKPNKELETSLDLDIPDEMPFIVVIIDELADLMMVASSDIETPIARIAQMARAVGIHMILATQRPSREVITGIIKANFPCRIAFKVSSRVNSQIIIDENGAETLIGNGDMLFLPPGSSSLVRAQGAFIRDEDINQVIRHCCAQAHTNYLIPSFDSFQGGFDPINGEGSSEKDSLFEQAKALVFETGNASTTFLQRKMKVGYARAASLMDQLEQHGIVGPSEGAKPRKIFYPKGD